MHSNKSHVRRLLEGVYVVLDGGEEGLYSVVRVCAYFNPYLVGEECVIEFCVHRQPGHGVAFKKFSPG